MDIDGGTIAALLAFAGLLVTQALLHRRWTREQEIKRDEAISKASESRRAEAATQAKERRAENAEILDRLAEQTNRVVTDALRIAEIHQSDAERARDAAIVTAQAHADCRQEVAMLGGKIEELRGRVVENERTSGREAQVAQRHQDMKHKTFTALTVSEGITTLAVSCAKNCSCSAFAPMTDLLETYQPRLQGLVDENSRLFDPSSERPPAATVTP